MFFDVYGDMAMYQWLGWLMVFGGLIAVNELARRSKKGGIFCFVVLPIIMSIYCIAIAIGVSNGQEWALTNPTHLYQNSWFHYAKVYAATTGCIGFMILKYHWGKLGKSHWFKAFPFVIVAFNILLAVIADFQVAAMGWGSEGWITTEGTQLYGGWWNIFNGIAGLFTILCMTGWWGIYSSKKQHDMLWPDMTWVFIIAYDIWNFTYTYNCLPEHSFYCGFALLFAPTVANYFWNKGGWIMNRANTLAVWCMFAQCFPLFLDGSPFMAKSVMNMNLNLGWSIAALIANIGAFVYIMYRAKKLHKNPYTNEIFTGTRDFEQAMARREDAPAQA